MSTDQINRSIGQRLARLRREAGWSQEAVARRLGVTQPWVSERERGNTTISAPDVVRFCEAIGQPPEVVLKGA